MGADEVLTSPDQPVRAEVVHESDRTRVTRVFLPGGTVIRKEPLALAFHESLTAERRA